jgi:inner membrane protein
MALPIAHAAAGYLVHRAERRFPGGDRPSIEGWRRVAVLMLIGNLPDMDFVVGFVIGRPGLLHRGVSHTVLAGVLFGVAAGAFMRWRWRERFASAALVFGAAYLSHLVIDYFTIDSRPPAGAQFLWPFSSEYFLSPVTIFGEIYIDGRTRAGFLSTVLAWPTVVVLAREIVIAVVAVGAWLSVESWRSRHDPEGLLVLDRGEEDLA